VPDDNSKQGQAERKEAANNNDCEGAPTELKRMKQYQHTIPPFPM